MTSARTALVTLTVHVALVAAVLAAPTLALREGRGPDAGIGAGLAVLGLAGLGLPWSLLVLLDVVPWSEQDWAERTAGGAVSAGSAGR